MDYRDEHIGQHTQHPKVKSSNATVFHMAKCRANFNIPSFTQSVKQQSVVAGMKKVNVINLSCCMYKF